LAINASQTLEINLYKPHLIVLIGAAGSGKSTFARKHFRITEIVSSDYCRALVGDNEEVQYYSKQAFELFYFIIQKRMELNKLVVADSTALNKSVRQELLRLARRHYYPATAIILNTSLETRLARNSSRNRVVPQDVMLRQQAMLEVALQEVHSEGWDKIYILNEEEADIVRINLITPPIYPRVEPPYDIVGDVHGCYDELLELLDKLGWQKIDGEWKHPEGRTLISIGDLADRGPKVVECFELWMELCRQGKALFTPGNHDNKLMRYLEGRRVQIKHGLEATVGQLESLDQSKALELRRRIHDFIKDANPYMVLDRYNLVVAHAGIKERMIGKMSRAVQDFVLYGDVTGRLTPEGLPERRDWARDYHGRALVVYGHTPVQEPIIRNNTVNIDQGCVFGGYLTALRYPELEFVQVKARQVYAERPGGIKSIVTGEVPTVSSSGDDENKS